MADPDLEPSLQLWGALLNIYSGPVTPGIIISLLLIVVLLMLSAAISGSEIAMFSLSPAELNDIRNSNNKTNQLIIHLLEKPKRLIATILIANNFVNVSIVILSSYVMAGLFDFSGSPLMGFFIQVIVVTVLLLFSAKSCQKYMRLKT